MQTMEEAFKKAGTLPKKNEEKGELSGLFNLDKIRVEVRSEEEAKKKLALAAARKAYAERAGKLIGTMRARLRQLQLAQSIGILTLEEEAELKDLKGKEEEIILKCDEALRGHVAFSVFIEEVRNLKRDRDFVKHFLREVVKMKRYRLATDAEKESARQNKAKWPEGTLFGFEGDVYLLNVAEEVIAANKALAIEMAKAIRETKDKERAEEASEIQKLKKEGNPDMAAFREGKPGKYVIYFEKDVARKSREGAGLVTIKMQEQRDKNSVLVIQIVDGAGSLRWFRDHSGKWISFSIYKAGVPDSLPEEMRVFAEKFSGVIRAGIAAYFHRIENE